MKISCTYLSLWFLASALASVSSFSVPPAFTTSTTTTRGLASTTALGARKGFGDASEKSKEPAKSAGQIQREKASNKYDELASTGGQEYNIYVRQFGSDDQSWLPCGSIAVPRNAQVSDALFANEANLKTSITRSYQRLKGFEEEFEFGFNLKVYPDDPIDVCVKGTPKQSGLSIGNWISTLLSPIDASKAKPPTN